MRLQTCLKCGTKLPTGFRKFCSTSCRDWWNNRKYHTRIPHRERQVIWAAGFLDGEGSISLSDRGGGKIALVLSASQTKTREPMEILHSLFGGTVGFSPERGARAAVHTWQLTGMAAVTALHHLWPYLVVKRPQAKVAEEWGQQGWSSPGKLMTETRKQTRAVLHAQMRALNARGPESAKK